VVHADGSTRMGVAGLQGWMPGRSVRYGEFSTGALARSMVREQVVRCPDGCMTVDAGAVRRQFDSEARSSTGALSFMQFGPQGQSAEVHATLSTQSHEAGWATTLFGVQVGGGRETSTSEFTGLVETPDGSRPTWRFALLQDSGTDGIDRPAGWAADEAGHRIVLRHMPPPAGTPAIVLKMARGMGPGLLFELDGRVVGGVDRSAQEVWLRDDLAPDLRLALAGMATAVLLRPMAAS
jgi:hypothetical protein